ncbi:MAG: hypothetical protein LH473_01640 [Chitinophagales bacterium]|nr:hypothetical protein [Chitinophagales bacterium]
METNKMIQVELMETAPGLASISREHPFKLPEHYFEKAEVAILESIKINEAAKEVLLSENKEHLFKLPANYFDDLPGSILYKIKEEEINSATSKKGIVRFVGKNKWWMAAAASVLIVISLSIFKQAAVPSFVSTINNDTTYLLLESASALPDQMVVDLYLESQATTFTNSVIANNEVNYLMEAADLNNEYINSL